MDLFKKLNEYGAKRKPLFFAIDFEMKEWICEDENIQYQIGKFKNFMPKKAHKNLSSISALHVDFNKYKKSISKVKKEIKKGNTYFLNLTFENKLKEEIDMESLFYSVSAPFKLHVKNKFVCFSPERFIKIMNNKISTYPMKGTISSSVPYAKKKILADRKEKSEHVMVVDLLRNDLSRVGTNTKVDKFRYISEVCANNKKLYQVSSKITAKLDENWQDKLGDILKKLLPAGSITGAPKIKTIELIKKIENYNRGFFTGIFGYYDGKSFDSAVMIRFLEKKEDGYVYKSGGGITIDSDERSEYEEMIDKIYLPFGN